MPKTELYDIDWRETSFVPAGDNPPARIVMWKSEPGITDVEIEEILKEVAPDEATAPTRKEGPVPTMTKQSVEAEVQRRAGELMKVRPELTPVSARLEIWAELRDRYEEAPDGEPVPVEASAPVAKAAEPYSRIDAAAKEALPDLYRRSPSMARTEVAKIRPDLQADYHAGHGRR